MSENIPIIVKCDRKVCKPFRLNCTLFSSRIQLHIQRVINHDHIRFPIILANKHPVHPVRIFFARPNTFPFQVDAHIYFLNLNTYIFSRIAVLRNSRNNHTNTFHNLSSIAYYENRVEIL